MTGSVFSIAIVPSSTDRMSVGALSLATGEVNRASTGDYIFYDESRIDLYPIPVIADLLRIGQVIGTNDIYAVADQYSSLNQTGLVRVNHATKEIVPLPEGSPTPYKANFGAAHDTGRNWIWTIEATSASSTTYTIRVYDVATNTAALNSSNFTGNTPPAFGSTYYLESTGNILAHNGARLTCFTHIPPSVNCEKAWEIAVSLLHTPIAVDQVNNQIYYVAGTTATVYAIDFSGAAVWDVPFDPAWTHARPLPHPSGGYLIITDTGMLHRFSHEGIELWALDTTLTSTYTSVPSTSKIGYALNIPGKDAYIFRGDILYINGSGNYIHVVDTSLTPALLGVLPLDVGQGCTFLLNEGTDEAYIVADPNDTDYSFAVYSDSLNGEVAYVWGESYLQASSYVTHPVVWHDKNTKSFYTCSFYKHRSVNQIETLVAPAGIDFQLVKYTIGGSPLHAYKLNLQNSKPWVWEYVAEIPASPVTIATADHANLMFPFYEGAQVGYYHYQITTDAATGSFQQRAIRILDGQFNVIKDDLTSGNGRIEQIHNVFVREIDNVLVMVGTLGRIRTIDKDATPLVTEAVKQVTLETPAQPYYLTSTIDQNTGNVYLCFGYGLVDIDANIDINICRVSPAGDVLAATIPYTSNIYILGVDYANNRLILVDVNYIGNVTSLQACNLDFTGLTVIRDFSTPITTTFGAYSSIDLSTSLYFTPNNNKIDPATGNIYILGGSSSVESLSNLWVFSPAGELLFYDENYVRGSGTSNALTSILYQPPFEFQVDPPINPQTVAATGTQGLLAWENAP